MIKPRAIVFDLLTALLDSWSVWNQAAGGEEHGRSWRARYLELTYGCGAYRPYETLVAEAAEDAGLPPTAVESLLARWHTLQPWPEAPDILRELKARGSVARRRHQLFHCARPPSRRTPRFCSRRGRYGGGGRVLQASAGALSRRAVRARSTA